MPEYQPDPNPSVFIAPPAPAQAAPVKKPQLNLKILIMAGLAAAVLILLIIFALGRINLNNTNTQPGTGSAAVQSKPKLVLISDRKEYKVGQGVILAVGLSTGNKPTDGTDLVLHFDNQVLQASSSAILEGSLYPDYPLRAVDQKSGLVRISGIAAVNKSYTGSGIFATILFQAVKPGQAVFTIDYRPGLTTDSNIVESGSGQDILSEADNLEVTVK